MIEPFDVFKNIREEIINRGGFVNCHAHLDRTFTLTKENFHMCSSDLKDKWKLIDNIKEESSYYDIRDRINKYLIRSRQKNCKNILTFIDVDPIIENKAITAIDLIREENPDINIVTANQTLKGVLDKEAYKWFEIGATYCDILGSLPKIEGCLKKQKEHLDIVFETANKYDKKVHIHVDQFSLKEERETELVIEKIKQYNMHGKVTLIHCLSLASQEKNYRHDIYQEIANTDTSVICCSNAWIDQSRFEESQPAHNFITPVDEMLDHNILVGMGTDNVSDIILSFSNGNMMHELSMMIKACRLYDRIDDVIDIATVNGKKILDSTIKIN